VENLGLKGLDPILLNLSFRQDLQDCLDFFLFGFPDESQKTQSPPANK
jgi:hypothetical protein